MKEFLVVPFKITTLQGLEKLLEKKITFLKRKVKLEGVFGRSCVVLILFAC
jgi:hypothetical protein